MKIETVKISAVKSNPNNPRIIKDDKFKKLVTSIKEFPQMLNIRPIVVNDEMIVLGGNMRLKACIEAGLKEVAIIKASELTPEQQNEFIIKDNVGFGEWDWNELANTWDAEQLVEWGLDIPSFEVTNLEAEEDDFKTPEGGIETDIVIGDLFEIGEHRLLCGDSTDSDQVAKLMNGQKADMVFTDPPYNGQLGGGGFKSSPDIRKRMDKMSNSIEKIYTFSPSEFLNILNLFCKNTINMFFFCNKNLVPNYINFALENKKKFDLLLWHKPNFLPMLGGHYYPDTEYLIKIKDKGSIFINGLGKEVNYGTYWIIESLKGEKKEGIDHPTIKPQKIITDCIKINSNSKDLVLDCFLGSGSTMVASHQLKRKCYGMELDPKYCQVIIDRMKKLDTTLIIKRNGIRQD